MKKRKSIAELIDGILEKRAGESAEATDAGSFAEADGFDGSYHLARLGEAFLARLNIPEGMDEAEAVERIIAMWNDADARRNSAEALKGFESGSEGFEGGDDLAQNDDDGERLSPVQSESAYGEKQARRLPAPIRGGLFEAPAADYESMSAEQFRRLKKQLERANMDGRRIRL